jgi:predicted  nucleic acid-binding Zn-ribbon protein
MTDTATQAVAQVTPTEPRSAADVPAWRELLEEVEYAADRLSNVVEELTEALDRFEGEDDVPDEVREAANDASTEVYSIVADVERKVRALRAAVDSAA